ncbi:MAG: glycosyltransferase family 4 protein [Sulfurimonas sp.]|nr:glycosyltransferase family 4 protein [Sulfurimonas sp.]
MQKKLKILIDTIPLLKNLTGIGYVTYIYAKELRKFPNDYIYYYAWFASSELKERPLVSYEKAVDWIKKFVPRPYIVTHSVKTVIFNIIILLKRPDVFFQPNYISFKMLKKVPTVTMVHDLSHIHYAHYHPQDRINHYNKELQRSLDNSKKIIAISEFTKQDLVSLGMASEDKIEVIYNGVSDAFKPLQKHLDAHDILKKYDLEEKSYFLFVGTMEPRKNLNLLLSAYIKYSKKVKVPTPLVLAGGIGWRSDVFDALLKEALLLKSVKKVGYVSSEDLPVLYAGAKIFIFPSHYEGFGLPPLEAMASATAVIASSSSSIPEVLGDAGILIDPNNEKELLDAILDLDADAKKRKKYELLGATQAKKFNWQDSAKKLNKVLVDVASLSH